MGIPAIWKSTRRNARLMYRMFDRLGVDQETVGRQALATMAHAAAQCSTCPGSEACARWLEYTGVPSSAPTYCLNRELMARLQRIVGPGIDID